MEIRTLRLKVGTLHRELRKSILELQMGALHRRATHEWGSEGLTRLWNVRSSITSWVLARENHLALAIFLHLFQLVFNDNDLIDQMLDIRIVGVKQLKLDVVIESFEKHVLLLLIGVDIVGCVSTTEWTDSGIHSPSYSLDPN
jgi:hypothetical protein